MMKKACMCLLAGVAGLGLAANANATGQYSAADYAVPTMTYGTAAEAAAALAPASAYTGVGTLFISTKATATNGGYGYICTGSLINATTVLTAAHCLYDYDETTSKYDPVTSVDFYLPSLGAAAPTYEPTFQASDWEYNPLYDTVNKKGKHSGDIVSGHDVGLFTLSTAATGYDTYSLYTGDDALGAYTEVGTGTIGDKYGTSGEDDLKRTGNNIFELYGDDLFSDATHGIVLSDFDDGTAEHDVFGHLTKANSGLSAISQTGVLGEADSSPGDSGGPEFNAAGEIVSVTSFGETGAILQGYCGTNKQHASAIDPYRISNDGTAIVGSYTTDLSYCTNSSIGEIAGDTLVSYNTDFIDGYIAAHPNAAAVPEPASWAMFIVGFGAVGGAFRRRAKLTGVSYSQAV